MANPYPVTPETLTKADITRWELRYKISDELGLKISTVYAWGSRSREIPDKHIQAVCDVINTFDHDTTEANNG